MKVCVIGAGSIGTTLVSAMEGIEEIEQVYVIDNSRKKIEALERALTKVKGTESFDDALEDVDLVIEAASQSAVEAYLPRTLESGKDFMVMSVGALLNDEFRSRCRVLAKQHDARIYIPSGAVCGIEGLCAAAEEDLEEVVLISYKHPKALEGVEYLRRRGIDLSKITHPRIVFDGTASDVVRHFPKNVNVAATISLAGLGFERTRVRIVADPKLTKNMHRIVVKGRVGEIEVWCRNAPFPDNPRTSYLAALSVIAAVRKITGKMWIGV